MILFQNFHPIFTNYLSSVLISLMLAILTAPFMWIISDANIEWVIGSMILWMIGSFVIYYPFITYIFPLLFTRLGNFLLGSILALFTLWLNIALITFFLSPEDIDFIFNHALFHLSIDTSGLLIMGYIIMTGILVLNLNCREEKKQRTLTFNFSIQNYTFLYRIVQRYYPELILVAILPILLLFWINITYSSRVLLGVFVSMIGISIFINRFTAQNTLQRLSLSFASLVGILVLYGGVINVFGKGKLPASEMQVHLPSPVADGSSFQFYNTLYSHDTHIYKIVGSFPSFGIHLGYEVDTIPNGVIKIESDESHYTVYDQLNHRLATLEK